MTQKRPEKNSGKNHNTAGKSSNDPEQSDKQKITTDTPNPVSAGTTENDKLTPPKAGEILFPVVGIGASAGGLEAFKNFFQAMPPDSGMAFVLVQHLDPNHESMMTDLLTKYTSMRVKQIEDGMPLEPNTVFMIPPNKYLFVQNGELRLSDPEVRRGMRMPIDFFFRSMAKELGDHAICIVLSGTGADGTLGLRAIKGEGGTALAQEPCTAQYDGMPQSAIATGLVDFVLPNEEMPKALLNYVKHFQIRISDDGHPLPKAKTDGLQSILALLRARTNHDFRCYKKGTLTRRIHRRMGLRQTDGYLAYLNLLREDSNEVKSLLRDLLIGVTSFFRDPDAWKNLEGQVLLKILEQKNLDDQLRIWVPGCCSGEEAYSIAIAIAEIQAKLGSSCTVQIFASDIDETALETARNGVYPESIAADVSSERLRRFFLYEEGQYRVCKQIRDSVVFASQNLIRDPPFSKLDLISCRNLLIYLDTPIQSRIIALLHFSLKDGGYLFLGPSESVSQQDDLFETVSKKWRIFRRIGVDQRYHLEFPLLPGDEVRRSRAARELAREPRPGSMTALAYEVLLKEYAPASVIVNRKCEAMYYYGPVARYFEIASGEPTRDITELARDGLRIKLRSAIQRSIRENDVIDVSGRIRGNNQGTVNIKVRPLDMPTSPEGLLLITFEGIDDTGPVNAPIVAPVEQLPDEVRQLEYELTATREDLQSTIEELETSNEELKASNEEVMSMNEELQSTNEELETSKEELQSLNEELNTVNNQLQEKVQELEAGNNDMVNLLNSTNVATLFLDRQLQVRRFTPAITRLFRLIPADVGRPLGDIALRFSNGGLLEKAAEVLKYLQPMEETIEAEDGGSFLCRVLPYRTMDDRIDGVVLTFVDISEVKKAYAALREREAQLQLFIEHAPVAVAMFDRDMHYLATSHRWLADYGLNGREIIGRSHYDILPDLPERWKEFHRRGLEGEVLGVKEDCFDKIDGSQQWLRWEIRPWRAHDDSIGGIIIVTEDITTRKLLETQLYESEERFRSFMDNSPAIAWIKDEQGRHIYISGTYEKRFGFRQADVAGKTDFEIWPPEIAENFRQNDEKVLNTGQVLNVIEETEGIGGRSYWQNFKFLMQDTAGRRYVGGIGIDVTETRRTESALAEAKQKLQHDRDILQTVMDGAKNSHLVYLDPDFNFVEVNAAYAQTCGYRPEEMIGKNHFELYPDEESQAIFIHVRDTGEPFEAHDRPFLFPDQPERGVTYWDWLLIPVTGSSGKVEGLVFSLHETTQRKISEEKLRLAARVFDRAGEGIMITDADKQILTVNNAFTDVTGYSVEDVIGKTPAILASGRHNTEFYQQMWAALNEHGWWQGEIWNRRKNGDIYPEWLTINLVHDSDNQLINYVGIFSDISVVKESNRRMEFLASHDDLTGLPNRALFYDRINQAIAHARREAGSFAVLFIDLDNFKVINDSLGHEAGDELLKEVSLRLRTTLRAGDTVARFGGDEFTLIIEDADAKEADMSAKRLAESLSSPINVAGQKVYVSASIGIGLFPSDGDNAETLLKHADGAMYQAKESGKGTHRFFTNDLKQAADERLQLESGLRAAIEQNQLFLLYQPQIDLESGRLTGIEALVRWQHPEIGQVPPVKFIPIAEKSGMIDRIGEWVADAACKQMADWQNQGLDLPRMSINVSPEQLRRSHLPNSIRRLLTRYRLPAEKITIELTESALMDNPAHAQRMLADLKAMGLSLSIDDFGTGYSSLSYLRRFSLDELKIDRSFVDEVASNGDDYAIALAVIEMAKALGLAVVAEGIETQEQLDTLLNLGCRIGQGYLFAKPISADEIAAKYLR